MADLPEQTLSILRYLKDHDMDPVLYGSQGVSLYLGNFKDFSDVDLLVDERFLHDDWPILLEIMEERGFKLVNLREHEFKDSENYSVAFASEDILIRDGIVDDLSQLEVINVAGISIRTLRKEDFIKAYEFSRKDGYRKDVRGKNDDKILAMLKDAA